MTRRSDSAKGKPRRNRSLIRLKIAVFMPMPSARVRTARSVNPGDFRSWRMAKRRSVIGQKSGGISFGSECDDGINARRAARRQPRRDRDARGKDNDCANPDQWIARWNLGPLMMHDL